MGRDGSYFVFLYFSDSGSRLCFISCACFFSFVVSFLLLLSPIHSFSLFLSLPPDSFLSLSPSLLSF